VRDALNFFLPFRRLEPNHENQLTRALLVVLRLSPMAHTAWLRLVAPDNATEIRALEADSGSHLGYVRVVGRRRADAPLYEPVVSVPAQYVKKPLLRGSE